MKNSNFQYVISCTIVFLIVLTPSVFAQTPGLNKSVQLSAIVQEQVPRITLQWSPFTDASYYSVYRKSPLETSWGTPLVPSLPGTEVHWADSTALEGQAYEYRVLKIGGNMATGYIMAGMRLPADERQKCLLLVLDTTLLSTFSTELNQWEADLTGEGWVVRRIPVSPYDSVQAVKRSIVQAYQLNPSATRAALLFGKVPVPYSGSIAPDGHQPDHKGAWPADGYYADIDGEWKDEFVNDTVANNERTRNRPGDGKFDPSVFPSSLELSVGRVDMSGLSQLGNESLLLKWYLVKNHLYRTAAIKVRHKALIDDNFTGYGEGFSASAWRTFPTIVGTDSIEQADYFGNLRQKSYLWSYGCGAGNYTGASGIGNSAGFGADSLQGIFTMLFGSYFGDWHTQNNFLRAAIGTGNTLTNVWSGRPIWHFHHMSLGYPIGFSTLQAMNNISTYDINNGGRGVHMALMGDPTLSAFTLEPPSQTNATFYRGNVLVTWTTAENMPDGYFVYKQVHPDSLWQRITPAINTQNSFTDSCVNEVGPITYWVRAVKLENSPSGSFYVLSAGDADTITIPVLPKPDPAFTYQAVQNNVNFQVLNPDTATSYFWNFGDGQVASGTQVNHTYNTPGTHHVVLRAIHFCKIDSSSQQIEIHLVSLQPDEAFFLNIFPNPANDLLVIRHSSPQPLPALLTQPDGRIILKFEAGQYHPLSLKGLSKGMYLLSFSKDGKWVSRKLLIVG